MTQVKLQHLRGVPGLNGKRGFCLPGARAWSDANGFDWRAFAREGIAEEQLLATGDPLALRLVEHARQVESESAKD